MKIGPLSEGGNKKHAGGSPGLGHLSGFGLDLAKDSQTIGVYEIEPSY